MTVNLPHEGRGIAYGDFELEVGLRTDSLGRQSTEGVTAISSLESYFGASLIRARPMPHTGLAT
ncbi:hypothetical protein ASD12_27080 [Mesorhizobium sp. Root102]|nr:hypothetical protein ASD12_27080 [Mesorhizobium sp. Root102]